MLHFSKIGHFESELLHLWVMTSVFLKYPFHIFTIVCLIIHPLNKITLLLVRYLPTTNLVLNLVSNLDTVHQNQELKHPNNSKSIK